MKKVYWILLAFLIFIYFAKPVLASPIINEVYPRPNPDEKEWIELFNNSQEIIDLTGWILMDELSASSIIFQFNQGSEDTWKIEPLTYVIIEIENSKLNNTADGVKLINTLGETIDQFEYTNAEQGMSFALVTNSDQDQTSIILSVPSKGLPNPIPTSSNNTESEISDETNENAQNNYPSLEIYEVMSCPEENNSEWIKIKNSNDETVNLENWLLKDSADNQILLTSTETIPAQSFITIYLKSNILNNSGDIVTLLDPNKNIVDTLELGQCTEGIPISAELSLNGDNNSLIEVFSTNVTSQNNTLQDNNQQIIANNNLEQKILSLKKINGFLTVINADKSSSAKTDNYVSKQVVVKKNSLPKTAIISVIIGGAILASSGLFFINHEKI